MTRTQMGDTRRTQMGADPQVKAGLTPLDRPRYPHPAGRRHTRGKPLRELDRLMRERGGLPSLPEPVPLHKMAAMKQAATTTGGKRS